MADIFPHPCKDEKLDSTVYEFGCGTVTIHSKDGPLTVSHALFLLEMVKFDILSLAQK